MTENINNEILQECETEMEIQNNDYIDETGKNKKRTIAIAGFIAIVIVVILGGLFVTESEKYKKYPGTNLPDFGEYMGVPLDSEGYVDGLGKVYRYDIQDVLRIDPTAERMAEYSLMLEDYGYKPVGNVQEVGGNYILCLESEEHDVIMMSTLQYVGIGIKEKE